MRNRSAFKFNVLVFIAAALGVWAFVHGGAPAKACPEPPPLEERVDAADAVVIGTISKIIEVSRTSSNAEWSNVEVKVEKLLKGKVADKFVTVVCTKYTEPAQPIVTRDSKSYMSIESCHLVSVHSIGDRGIWLITRGPNEEFIDLQEEKDVERALTTSSERKQKKAGDAKP